MSKLLKRVLIVLILGAAILGISKNVYGIYIPIGTQRGDNRYYCINAGLPNSGHFSVVKTIEVRNGVITRTGGPLSGHIAGLLSGDARIHQLSYIVSEARREPVTRQNPNAFRRDRFNVAIWMLLGQNLTGWQDPAALAAAPGIVQRARNYAEFVERGYARLETAPVVVITDYATRRASDGSFGPYYIEHRQWGTYGHATISVDGGRVIEQNYDHAAGRTSFRIIPTDATVGEGTIVVYVNDTFRNANFRA